MWQNDSALQASWFHDAATCSEQASHDFSCKRQSLLSSAKDMLIKEWHQTLRCIWIGLFTLAVAGAWCMITILKRSATGPVAVSVAACGDVMIQNLDGTTRISDAGLLSFMSAAAPWFKSADIGFANIEGPIGGAEPKACQSIHCHRFKQGPLTAQALAAAGVSAASLANNHTNDMGASGQMSTLKATDEAGIHAAGLMRRTSARWMQSGLSIELLAMTANSFAPDFRRPESLDLIKQAKRRSNIVIVSVHMGCEGASCARLRGGTEIFIGEDRGDPRAFGNAAVDAGADLVIGSGPHVPRGMALRSGHLIAYSLGNCAAGPGLSTAGPAGWAPVLWAGLDAQGHLVSWDVGSFIGDGLKMTWDPAQRALLWMSKATELDSGAVQWGTIRALWHAAPARVVPLPP